MSVRDSRGAPIEAAEIAIGDTRLVSDVDGSARLPAGAAERAIEMGALEAVVAHRRFVTRRLDMATLLAIRSVVLEERWTLHVDVRDGNGVPVTESKCVISFDGEEANSVRVARSSSNGLVEFAAIDADLVRLQVSAHGFRTEVRDLTRSLESPTVVVVSLAPEAVLDVSVVDENGIGAEHARVVVSPVLSQVGASGPAVKEGATDALGLVRFDGLERGRAYTVTATFLERESVATVRLGDRGRDSLLIELEGRCRVYVSIVDSEGDAVDGEVRVSRIGTGDSGMWPGSVRVHDVSWTSAVGPDGSQVHLGEGVPSGRVLEFTAFVGGASVSSVSRAVEEGAIFSIVVPRHYPVAVDVLNAGGLRETGSVQCFLTSGFDDDGKPLRSRPRYVADIDALGGGQLTLQAGSYELMVLDHIGQAVYRTDVEIAGATTLVCPLGTTGSMSGVLVTQGGSPVAAWEVLLRDRDGGALLRSLTDEGGRFAFVDVRSHSVDVGVVAPRTNATRYLRLRQELPTEGLVLEIDVVEARVSLLDWETGADIGGQVRVSGVGEGAPDRFELPPAVRCHPGRRESILLPAGDWVFDYESESPVGFHWGGSTRVNVREAGDVDLLLVPYRKIRFAADDRRLSLDAKLYWEATRSGRTVSGLLFRPSGGWAQESWHLLPSGDVSFARWGDGGPSATLGTATIGASSLIAIGQDR